MNGYERIKAVLDFKVPDRVPYLDAPWAETIERWAKELGKPFTFKDFHEYFNMDVRNVIKLDTSFRFDIEMLEENSEFMIVTDADGKKIKYWKNQTGVPHPLEYKVKDRASWEAVKSRLKATEDRISVALYGEYKTGIRPGPQVSDFQGALKKYKESDRSYYLFAMAAEPYEASMSRVGDEGLLLALYDDPDMVHDIFDTHTNMVIGLFEIMFKHGMKPDGVFIGGDIAYKNGMLFSPEKYREILMPYHKRLFGFLRDNNLPVVYHTDGNIREALPLLIESGITCIEPMEAKASVDVRELKKQYDKKVCFMGNIDMMKVSGTRKDVEEEVISKVEAAKIGGGYIYHSDHTVPPSVSFENYKYIIELVKKHGKY